MSASPAIEWREGSHEALTQSARALNSFLRESKTELRAIIDSSTTATTDRRPTVHVMIGNEAADADSIVSSIVYAHFKHEHKAATAASNTLYIPVLPIPRDELVLRCDVSALFAELRIDLDALTFVNEFPWQHAAFERAATLQLTLLDHNALNTKRMVAPSAPTREVGDVVEIVDHHMDARAHLSASVREIAFADGQALVASTCTLVAEKLLAQATRSAHHALHATLLLAVMALDSVNFNPSAKKVTPRDVAAASSLDSAACASADALFAWLQAEKFNPEHWAAFSLLNCLQCDFKECATDTGGLVGVSAVLIDIARFALKVPTADALVAQLEAFAASNDLTFVLVMAMVVDPSDGSRSREMLFFARDSDPSIAQRCIAFLLKDGSLQLEPLALPPTHRHAQLQAFAQRNVAASRKQVVPLLQRALAAPASL